MVAAIRFLSVSHFEFPQGRYLNRCISGIAIVWILAIGSATFAQKGDKLPSGWKTFRPDDSSFEVAFPETPVRESTSETDHLGGQHKAVIYGVGKLEDEVSYSVTVIEGIAFRTAKKREKEFLKLGEAFDPELIKEAGSFQELKGLAEEEKDGLFDLLGLPWSLEVRPLRFPGAEDGAEIIGAEGRVTDLDTFYLHRRGFMKGNRLYVQTYSDRSRAAKVIETSAQKIAFIHSFRLLDQSPLNTESASKKLSNYRRT